MRAFTGSLRSSQIPLFRAPRAQRRPPTIFHAGPSAFQSGPSSARSKESSKGVVIGGRLAGAAALGRLSAGGAAAGFDDGAPGVPVGGPSGTHADSAAESATGSTASPCTRGARIVHLERVSPITAGIVPAAGAAYEPPPRISPLFGGGGGPPAARFVRSEPAGTA